MQTCCPNLTAYVTAVFTAIIAIFGAYIAYQQMQVSRNKLKLDLFEKRYEIFLETWKFLSEIAQGGAKNQPVLHPIMNQVPPAMFLFGVDIAEYIKQANSKRIELSTVESEIHAVDDATAFRQQKRELLDWFNREASDGVKSAFSKYLDFSRWH